MYSRRLSFFLRCVVAPLREKKLLSDSLTHSAGIITRKAKRRPHAKAQRRNVKSKQLDSLISKLFQLNSKHRRSGRDCRNPVAMDGNQDSPPCVLDTGNPCRYDAQVGLAEESS